MTSTEKPIPTTEMEEIKQFSQWVWNDASPSVQYHLVNFLHGLLAIITLIGWAGRGTIGMMVRLPQPCTLLRMCTFVPPLLLCYVLNPVFSHDLVFALVNPPLRYSRPCDTRLSSGFFQSRWV